MANASRQLASILGPSPKRKKATTARKADPVVNSKVQFALLTEFGKKFISQELEIWQQWGLDPVKANMEEVFAAAFKVCPGLNHAVVRSALTEQIRQSTYPVVFEQLFS